MGGTARLSQIPGSAAVVVTSKTFYNVALSR